MSGVVGAQLTMGQLISHDLEIAKVAGRQQGNITWSQLLEIGLDRRTVSRRVRAGRLYRVYPGVYSVGRPARTGLERASAALLACGPNAALSHWSALNLWGLSTHWPILFDVLLFAGDRRPRGIRTHRAKGLTTRDRRKRNGLWVTSPARTLLDVAPNLTQRQLTRKANQARLNNDLTLPALQDVIHRFPLHPGARKLEAIIATGGRPTRSYQEDDFPAFCKRHGLPAPEMDKLIAGRERDAVFEQAKLIVELDTWETHQDAQSFHDDRERDAQALETGYSTIRLLPERWTATEAQRLRSIIERRER